MRIQGGGSDTQLNQTGKKQAESLALRLKAEPIQAIYSSPLQRALDTAQAVARYHQAEVEIEPALKEIDAAELEGVPIDQIGSHFSQLLTKGEENSSFFERYGGESLTQVRQRSWSIIQRLVNQHPDEVIVVVSHYFVLLTIICSVLNLPLSQLGRLRVVPGSISTIVFDEGIMRLVLLNDSCHLTNI